MKSEDVLFDKKIDGIRYIIYKFKIASEEFTTIKSSIPIQAPVVDKIKYSEKTKTFQMTDYMNVGRRKVKIMFYLDLNMRIVGSIYNDLDGSYDTIDPIEYMNTNITEGESYGIVSAYNQYRTKLQERLTRLLEGKNSPGNKKILDLTNNKN